MTTAIITVTLALMTSGPSTTTASAPSRPFAAQAAEKVPNIVLITTDDQTRRDLKHMPKTRQLLGKRGVEFKNALSPHPLCCPARAEILTGQFAQNNGVRTNTGEFGGAQALVHPKNTLPVWLQQAGYQTAFLGKYMNGQSSRDPQAQPEGWNSWIASYRDVYDYNNFVINHNGDPERHQGAMQADVYARLTGRLVTRMAGEKPFFIWQSQLAPHNQFDTDKKRWGWPTSSRRNRRTFDEQPLLSVSSPSYNEANVSDKPLTIRKLDSITKQRTRGLGRGYQSRLESLQDVDDSVAALVHDLKAEGEYRDTLIIFTSDNGYLMGEHRYTGKVLPYEESLHVPLLMSGAMVPSGAVRRQAVTLVDIAPTILDAANAVPGRVQDGASMLPRGGSNRAAGWDTVLLQAGPSKHVDGGDTRLPDPAVATPKAARSNNWLYRGVRTDRYTYVRYQRRGEVELYDRQRDPWQLHNVAADNRYSAVVDKLADRTRRLRSCSGNCLRAWGPVPAPKPR